MYNNSEAVYTGIETKKFYYKKSEDFYLSTARLDELKRIDLLISAFKKMINKKLMITGTGPDEARLKQLAGNATNIKFLGSVSEKELLNLYARCKATISANIDEDLGLSPIESQAAGKPSLVVNEGGFLETINKSNGVFFKPNVNSLISAVNKLEKKKWNHKAIRKSAKKYDINTFAQNMLRIVNKVVKQNK